MVAEQNVICSLPGYKYQIAPLARGYTCAVADCTFILAKRVFFCSIGYSLLWNHSPSEWFSFYKTVVPGPSGRQQRGIKIAPGTTSRALSGSVRIQDFMWRTQPGAGCLGDISLPLTGRAIHSLGQYRIILSADTASEVRQPPERCLSRQAGIVRCCLRVPPAPSGGRRATHRGIPGYGPPRSGWKQNLPGCCCWGR